MRLEADSLTDARARHFIGQLRAFEAAHARAALKPHGVGAAVVFNGFGFAFNVFICVVALLAKERALAFFRRERAALLAIAGLLHLQARAAHEDAALGEHDMAGEGAGLAFFFMPQGVGLDVHGLVTIGLFSLRARASQQGGKRQRGQARKGRRKNRQARHESRNEGAG